jgi:threonine dehydrogenase-like Zn-dependent dehydrogenase
VFPGGGRVGWHDREVPQPGAGELLVRVRANALCGTDRHLLERGSPFTPGHEVAGVVAVAGPATTTAPGIEGVCYLMAFCGTCRSCRAGATNQCLAKTGDLGFTHDGGLGAWVLVRESQLFPTPGVEPGEATLLLDVMGTTGHALHRARQLRDDVERVVVGGAGPLGLGVAVMARLLLGDGVRVTVGDVEPARLDLARELGADVVDVGRHGYPPEADLAIDTSGSAVARRDLLRALGRRGVLVCVGHGGDLALDVSADLIAPERSVLGSEYFRFDELAGNLALLREHRDILARIITHRVPADRVEDAIEVFAGGQAGKVVVVR